MVRAALSLDAIGPGLTGIGRYNWELALGLARQPAIDTLRYFVNDRWIDDPHRLLLGAAIGPARWKERARHWWRRRELEDAVVHGPNYFLPDWAPRGIITVHDLSVFRFPETHPVERLVDFERRFQSSLARASHVITDTEAVRGEVIGHFGLDPARVTAIPLGVRIDPPATGDDRARTLDRLSIAPGRFTLCVATIEPRKRIGQLLDAYGALDPALRRAYPLVLVGKEGWLADPIVARIDAAVAAGWARWTGYVTEGELATLYDEAALFCYPSLYEGFGLPPLEAMARGIPTIVSDEASLAEVTAGAAAVIDPEDRDAFAAAIARGLEDGAWRAAASAQGRAAAARLRWDETVARTADLYRRVAAG